MDNPVVVRAAEVAQAAGFATLRFNFRGAGGSEGRPRQGRGEQDDVSAALAALRDPAARREPGRGSRATPSGPGWRRASPRPSLRTRRWA